MLDAARSDLSGMMNSTQTHVRRQGLGPFLAASCGMVDDGKGLVEAVVVLWKRALELRCASGPRLLPRAIVRRIRFSAKGTEQSLVILTEGGPLEVTGRDLEPLARRLESWLQGHETGSFRPNEPVFGGGPGWLAAAGKRLDGTLLAVPGGVMFMPRTTGEPRRFEWSELRSARGRGLETADGACMGGDAVAAVLGARMAAEDTNKRLPRSLHLTLRTTTGWGRGCVWLCVGPRGVSSHPMRPWSRVLGSGVTQHWDWDSIRSIRSILGEPSGLSVDGGGAQRSWSGLGLRALADELKRTRWRAARSVARERPDRVAGTWRVCVEARQERQEGRGPGWSWGHLELGQQRLRFTPAGSDAAVFDVPVDDLLWRPQRGGPSPTLGLWLPQGRWSLRPPDGAGFMPTFASLLGAPQPVESPSSGDRRAGQRALVDLPAWIDQWGRVPYLSPEKSIAVLEVSVSGLVCRCTSHLTAGQKVSVAMRLGGPVVVTAATVVREVTPGTFAVRFDAPPAVLVQRLGRLVRQLERGRLQSERTEHVPLTMGG